MNTSILDNLFQAYYNARKNKRNTVNALKFELDYEAKLFKLYQEIKSRTYELSRSICFIVFKPVQREIFAADFRDRIVHHLIYNYINPFFERIFINDSYSCRVNKGTSYGIKRLDHFIRSCSRNYKQDCYILKLDIKGYFMSMDRFILYEKIERTLPGISGGVNVDFDIDLILYLIRKIVFHDPTKHCRIKGKKSDWQGLPASKSLFCSKPNQGLPIGNLTSQLFGNVYLNDFDHFIKYKLAPLDSSPCGIEIIQQGKHPTGLGCKYYGRYVDDFVIVHQDKQYLKSIIPVLRKYLQEHLGLELHNRKIYLQHFSKGVNFLGIVIKPYRIYIRNRTKGNFYQKIKYWNDFLSKNKFQLTKKEVKQFLACMNSYLGMMKHYRTYKLRQKILTRDLSIYFWNYVYIADDYSKLVLRKC